MNAANRVTNRALLLLALMALLALVVYLALGRNVHSAEEAVDEAVGQIAKSDHLFVRDPQTTVFLLALFALSAFAMWAALRAATCKEKPAPPAEGSAASDDAPRR